MIENLIKKITLTLVPITLIIFSVVTMLPENNIHKQVLNDDSFYYKFSEQIDKSLPEIPDSIFKSFDTGILSYNDYKSNAGSTAIFKERFEKKLKNTVEGSLDNISKTIKDQKADYTKQDNLSKIINFSSDIYSNRMNIIYAIVFILLLLFIANLINPYSNLANLSKFYLSLAWSQLISTSIVIIAFGGWTFLGSFVKDKITQYIGIGNIRVELYELVNYQFLKFGLYLLAPAILAICVFVIISMILGFVSLFQRPASKQFSDVNHSVKKNRKKYENKVEQPQSENFIIPDEQDSIKNQESKVEILEVVENNENTIVELDNIETKSNETNKQTDIPKYTEDNIETFLKKLSQELQNDSSTKSKIGMPTQSLESSIKVDEEQRVKVR